MMKGNSNPSYDDVMKDNLPKSPKEIYGIDVPKLVGAIEVEGGGGGGGGGVVGNITIPTGLTTGTYDLVSSDISLTPSSVNIKGYISNGNTSMCDIYISSTGITGFYSVGDSGGAIRYTTNRAINLFDTATNRFQANFVEFIAGGVRIDITRPNNTAPVEIGMIAYS